MSSKMNESSGIFLYLQKEYAMLALEKYLTGPFETLKDLSKNTKMRYK